MVKLGSVQLFFCLRQWPGSSHVANAVFAIAAGTVIPQGNYVLLKLHTKLKFNL